MKILLPPLMTFPLVLIGCLTLPVSITGATARTTTAHYDYARPQVFVAPASLRRRKVWRPLAVQQAMARADTLNRAKAFEDAVVAYQHLLRQIAGDDRFAETQEAIKVAIARAERERASPFWG